MAAAVGEEEEEEEERKHEEVAFGDRGPERKVDAMAKTPRIDFVTNFPNSGPKKTPKQKRKRKGTELPPHLRRPVKVELVGGRNGGKAKSKAKPKVNH